jgi:hypothetical protein
MKAGKKNGKTPMEKLTKGYEKFIKGKEINSEGKKLFDKTLNKSVKKQGGK